MDVEVKLKKLMNQTMDEGDYAFFDKNIKQLFKQFPKETYDIMKNECESQIEFTINCIEKDCLNLHDSFPIFFTSSYNLYKKVVSLYPNEFIEIWTMFIENTEYTRTLVQGLKHFKLKNPLDEDCINTMIKHLKTYLDIYDLDLKEFLSCACILNNKSYNKSSIENINKNDYEKLFSDAIKDGEQILLNKDFRHIRNSIAHGSFRIINKQQKIVFTDSFRGNKWEKEYIYDDFLLLVLIPYVWNWAITLSKLLIQYFLIKD